MNFDALVLLIILLASLVFLLVGLLKKNKGLVITGAILGILFLMIMVFLTPVTTVASY